MLLKESDGELLFSFLKSGSKTQLHIYQCSGFIDSHLFGTHILAALAGNFVRWFANWGKQESGKWIAESVFPCRVFDQCYLSVAETTWSVNPITENKTLVSIDFSPIIDAIRDFGYLLPHELFYYLPDPNCQHVTLKKGFHYAFKILDDRELLLTNIDIHGFGLLGFGGGGLNFHAMKAVMGLYAYYLFNFGERAYMRDALQFVAELSSGLYLKNLVGVKNQFEMAYNVYSAALLRLMEAKVTGTFKHIDM